MTRAEIEANYDISPGGTITSPGKFEGEMLYVPYFWDIYLNGFCADDDGETLTFEVDVEDIAQFPELEGETIVKLYERDDGFVCEVKD